MGLVELYNEKNRLNNIKSSVNSMLQYFDDQSIDEKLQKIKSSLSNDYTVNNVNNKVDIISKLINNRQSQINQCDMLIRKINSRIRDINEEIREIKRANSTIS